MSTLLTKILVEKSDDALNKLEDESKDFKREKFTYKEPFIKDNPGRTPSEVLAHAQWQMMKVTLKKKNLNCYNLLMRNTLFFETEQILTNEILTFFRPLAVTQNLYPTKVLVSSICMEQKI